MPSPICFQWPMALANGPSWQIANGHWPQECAPPNNPQQQTSNVVHRVLAPARCCVLPRLAWRHTRPRHVKGGLGRILRRRLVVVGCLRPLGGLSPPRPQSTSSTVGSPAAPPPAVAPAPPPCAACKIGSTTFCSSFCFSSYSSFSALWFSSSQASVLAMASVAALASVSDSLDLRVSSEKVLRSV